MKLFGMVGGLAMLIVFLGETQTNDLNSILIAIDLKLKYCICIDEYTDSRISYVIEISNKTIFSNQYRDFWKTTKITFLIYIKI